jgi:hypothetical protein
VTGSRPRCGGAVPPAAPTAPRGPRPAFPREIPGDRSQAGLDRDPPLREPPGIHEFRDGRGTLCGSFLPLRPDLPAIDRAE